MKMMQKHLGKIMASEAEGAQQHVGLHREFTAHIKKKNIFQNQIHGPQKLKYLSLP